MKRILTTIILTLCFFTFVGGQARAASETVTGQDGEQRAEIMRRATDERLPPPERAAAYVTLAGEDWRCSILARYRVEERTQHESQASAAPGAAGALPSGDADLRAAQQCAERGIELIEKALRLQSNSGSAWAYRTNLLREMAALAALQGRAEQQADYERQAEEAWQRTRELSFDGGAIITGRDYEVGAVITGRDVGDPASSRAESANSNRAGTSPPAAYAPISGGVLNGRVVIRPAPNYPAIARTARAQGMVTVQVLVDEIGRVAQARAVNGHPLLLQAAVQAAYRARFSPFVLQGQPVKVSGVITYNFVLQ